MSSKIGLLLVAVLAIVGCTSAKVVSSGGSPTIQQAQQEPYAGPKKRIAVKAFEFKAAHGSGEVGRGMSDMLADSLFNSNRFIVLERENIKEVIEEQDFGASGRVKKETAAPIGELEGAELIIRGSVTEFEPKCKGGALLIVAAQEACVTLNLRIVDARTGRVVNATTVEGRSGAAGVGLVFATGTLPVGLGRWFHLYLILDLYSRKIVGAEVHDSDDADHAAHLVRRTALAESIATKQSKPVLHGDNGSTLKATTVLAMLHWLGGKPSYSRPRVSDDNAYAESLFRTAKYRPEFPAKGFASLDEARAWAAEFVRWYNVEHRHSGIRYVSPNQRHAGDDRDILAARHTLYEQARQRHPARWSGNTRDSSCIGVVTLNPERDSVVNMAASARHTQQMAA